MSENPWACHNLHPDPNLTFRSLWPTITLCCVQWQVLNKHCQWPTDYVSAQVCCITMSFIILYSIHVIGMLFPWTLYIQLIMYLSPAGRGSGLGWAQARLSLTALAQPQHFKSPSHQNPGPSCGFEPKPGLHITIGGEPWMQSGQILLAK